MAQMSITAKIQVVASDEDKALLDETMSVYREACNYVSDYVFRTHDLKQFSLNKALYPTLRAEFGLKSQMTQSVFKTVIARYRTILENQKEWIKPSFKKPQYDLVWNRLLSDARPVFRKHARRKSETALFRRMDVEILRPLYLPVRHRQAGEQAWQVLPTYPCDL